MAIRSADQIRYSQELLDQYEVTQSYLRGLVNTEGNIEAKTFTWTIDGKAGIANERGANGMFQPSDDSNDQLSVTVKEYGSYRRKTGMNIYTSPVNERLAMQKKNIIEINKRTDKLIIDQLAAATQRPFGNVPAVVTFNKVLELGNTLDQLSVPQTDRVMLCTPKFYNRTKFFPQMTSKDYVSDEPFMKSIEGRVFDGTLYIRHPGLPGAGTASAINYLFHKQALGHAMVMSEEMVDSEYNREHAYFWANAITHQGAKLLLPEGVVLFVHDDATPL